MKKPISPARIGWLIAGAAFMATSVPAFAQVEEEVIVTGRYGSVPDSAKSLSQSVSYVDLDLSTAGGRAELRHRLRLTARF
ncbi:MAG: UrcA family protein, partial [Sphingomonadales bacterium]